MTEDELPPLLTGMSWGQPRPDLCDLAWRTRIVAASATTGGLVLAVDVHAHSDGTLRGDRRAIGARTLRLVVRLTQIALRAGFWAELLPARPSDDAQDGDWICAALLHLTMQSTRIDPDAAIPWSPQPDLAELRAPSSHG